MPYCRGQSVTAKTSVPTDWGHINFPGIKLPEWVGIPDNVMKDFKDESLPQDSFDAPGQFLVTNQEFSIENEIASFHDADLTEFENIFLAGAEFYSDGVKQDSFASGQALNTQHPTCPFTFAKRIGVVLMLVQSSDPRSLLLVPTVAKG